LSQTPHLLELIELSETTLNKQLHIKHDNDYDSELTDYEEEEEDPMKKEKKAINGNVVVQKFSDESDTSRDENNEKDSRTHRSIRVPEIDLILKEPQGNLTKQLGVVIKNMTSANTVVNPTTLFGLLSKRFTRHFIRKLLSSELFENQILKFLKSIMNESQIIWFI
jgi:hypothetical protein